MKPKPPQYPRIVPTIDTDEAPILASTIIFPDSLESQNDNFDVQASVRAAKRRRIADAATSYLRGEELFILSATLKGPFHQGWKNPWEKQKTVCKCRDQQLTSGETGEFETCQHTPRTEPEQSFAKHIDHVHGKQTTDLAINVGSVRLSETTIDERQPTPHDGVVKNWLKKSVDTKQNVAHITTSPTPSRRKSRRKHAKTSHPQPVQKYELDKSARSWQDTTLPKVSKGTINATTAHSRLQKVLQENKGEAGLDDNRPRSGRNPGIAVQSSRPKKQQTPIAVEHDEERKPEVRLTNIGLISEVVSDHTSEQFVPSSDGDKCKVTANYGDDAVKSETATMHHVRFNAERRKRDEMLADDQVYDGTTYQASGISRNKGQQEFQRDNPSALVSLRENSIMSTNPSNTIPTELPPSAQKISDPPISIPISLDYEPLIMPAKSKFDVSDASYPLTENTTFGQHQVVGSSIRLSSKMDGDVATKRQQEMDEARANLEVAPRCSDEIIPEEHGIRDVKDGNATTGLVAQDLKNPESQPQLAYSKTARPSSTQEKRKKTTFAEEYAVPASTNSIKDRFKVGKSAMFVSDPFSQSAKFPKSSTKMENFDSENYHHVPSTKSILRLSLSGSQTKSENAFRGILKNSSNHPSSREVVEAPSTSRTYGISSTFKQEAQAQHRMQFAMADDSVNNVGDVDEAFDLNDAIDDLGSFLCSWTTEKEVSGMAKLP